MNKAKTNDSAIAVEAFLYTDKRLPGFALSCAARIAVSAVGALGAAFTFLTAIDTGIKFFPAAALIVVACAVFGAVFCLAKKYALPALGAVYGVYAAAVFFLRDKFCNGLANTVNIYLATVEPAFRDEPFFCIASPYTLEKDTQIFVNLTVIFIALAFAYGIVYRSSLPAVLAVSVLPAELCLYFGISPASIAFFALISSWFAVFAFELSMPDDGKAYKKASAQCGVTTALLVLLCAGAAFLAMRISGYSRPEKLDEISKSATDYFYGGGFSEDISDIKIGELLKRDRTVNHGKLGGNGNITFDEKTALIVTLPKTTDTVYLRGFVGSVYTGSSWEELPQASLRELEEINGSFTTEGLSTLSLGSYNLKSTKKGITEYSFSVKNVGGDTGYLYMPYYTVPESISRYGTKNDAYISGGENAWFGRVYDASSVYGYRMLLNSAWVVPSASLARDEGAYRSFVYANYLDIPDNFAAAPEVFDNRYYEFISAEPEESGKSTLTEAVVFGRKLYYIRSWLRDNCEYSLSAGTLPAGKDFADHFLLDTRKGSCTHFATSAVLLCRWAGIPARYVEGYVVKPADFDEEVSFGTMDTVEVTDARAHAWAEVYINGFGWYPIEFTSGYGNVITAVTTAPAEMPEESAAEVTTAAEVTDVPEETTVPSPAESSPVPAPAQSGGEASSEAAEEAVTSVTEVSGGEYTVTKKPTVGFTAFGKRDGEERDVVYDLTAFITVIFVISAVTAAFGLRRVIKVNSSRKALSLGNEKAVKSIYARFMWLAKAAGIKEPAGNISYGEFIGVLEKGSPCFSDGSAALVVNTALKAEFGGGCVTKDDVKKMYTAVNHAVRKYESSLSGFKRFYFRYIAAIT